LGRAEYLRSLVAYNRWANDRILAAAEPLLGEKPAFADQYGVRPDTVLHILQAQEAWMARWRGEPVRETENPSTAELLAAFARSHETLEAFGDGLGDLDFDRRITYRDLSGDEYVRPLGLLITHLVSHGTYHRGDAALLLTQQGRSPGDLDYVDFLSD
jgi:uncharacterized damage-inducible protein DinB